MIYLEVLIVSMVFVAISHFLSTIPANDDDWSYDQYPKVIHILLTMIVIPLILAFTLIIYAYFLRILVTFTWPKGVVGQLVIWFGLAAWMTLFLLDELILTKKWQITWKKFFPYTFILPVVMLFIAIGIRINQHGITQLRYYVVLGGIWFSINILATLFSSRYKNMIYAISGSVLLLVASLGPLSSVNMSFRSQEGIITQILEAEGLLVSGQLVEAQEDRTLSEEENRTLYSALYYLEDIGKLEDVAFIDADFDLNRDYEAAFGLPIVSPRYMGDYRYLESIQETSIYVDGGYVIPFYRYNSFGDLPVGNFLVSVDEKGIEINTFDGNQVFLVTYETMAEILETRDLTDGRNYKAEDLRLEFNEKSIKVIIQIYRFNYNREDMDIDQAEGLIIIEENR